MESNYRSSHHSRTLRVRSWAGTSIRPRWSMRSSVRPEAPENWCSARTPNDATHDSNAAVFDRPRVATGENRGAIGQQGCRMAYLRGGSRQHSLPSSRSNRRIELQQAGSCLDVQNRQSRPEAGVPARRNSADGWRSVVRHRWNSPRRRGARRGHRRTALDAQRE